MNPEDFAAAETPVTPPTDDQIAAATWTLANQAHDADDLRTLLAMLGIDANGQTA